MCTKTHRVYLRRVWAYFVLHTAKGGCAVRLRVTTAVHLTLDITAVHLNTTVIHLNTTAVHLNRENLRWTVHCGHTSYSAGAEPHTHTHTHTYTHTNTHTHNYAENIITNPTNGSCLRTRTHTHTHTHTLKKGKSNRTHAQTSPKPERPSRSPAKFSSLGHSRPTYNPPPHPLLPSSQFPRTHKTSLCHGYYLSPPPTQPDTQLHLLQLGTDSGHVSWKM